MRTLVLILISFIANVTVAQIRLDTLAIQNFDSVPMSPIWQYNGILSNISMGYSGSSSNIPNSPLGINGSASWSTDGFNGANSIVFNNQIIPTGFDTVRVSFRLAAINPLTGGGLDYLDYVLVEYSLDSGLTFTKRLRIRGARSQNAYWPFNATGKAKLFYLPANEVEFLPTTSGLQTSEGFSYCEIAFPGTINQITMRITLRTSIPSETWLLDNLVLVGESPCTITYSNISDVGCNKYLWKQNNTTYYSSGVYKDTIKNSSACDSIVTLNLTLDTVNINVSRVGLDLIANQAGANYQWLDCNNNYAVITAASSKVFTPIQNGSYAVEVDLNNCKDTSICETILNVGIEEFSTTSTLIIFPNPASDYMMIESEISNVNNRIKVFDITSKLILEHQMKSNKEQIDISKLNNGLYFIQLGSDIEKLVISR